MNEQPAWARHHRMRLEPQCTGGDGRINIGFPPPCGFVATPMNLAMVSST
jgi:hypothetical protein